MTTVPDPDTKPQPGGLIRDQDSPQDLNDLEYRDEESPRDRDSLDTDDGAASRA